MTQRSQALRRTWQLVAQLPSPAEGLTAVLLPGGSVVALGGDAALRTGARMAAELAPDATAWTKLPGAPVELATPAALALNQSAVLVVAPAYANGNLAQPSKALLLDTVRRHWTVLPAVPLPLLAPHLLQIDKTHVLAAGAVGGPLGAIFDLQTYKWTVIKAPVKDLASYSTTFLPGRGVLLMASVAITANGQPYAVRRAWLLDERIAWHQVARPPVPGDGAQAVVVDADKVLFAGARPTGDNPGAAAPPPLLYDAAGNNWVIAGDTGQVHRGGLVVALGYGHALLIGGHDAQGAPTTECLLFDGSRWHSAESLPSPWAGYAVVGLPDSRVLLIGGDRRKASVIQPVADTIEWSLDPGFPS